LDPESVYHVVARGNNGGWIVRDAIDRSAFRSRLGAVAVSFEWQVFAWCLMTTHVHVVLRAPTAAISSGVQSVNGRHAQLVDHRHGRTGHLFENRFFAVEVSTDAHFISSIAYANRNPVAACVVEAAGDWRDSRYRSIVGIAVVPTWLAIDEVLGVFGSTPAAGRAAFVDVVHSGRVPVSDTIDAVRRFETRGILEPVATT
jgi:REP element-mobilizing transposase RayT